MILTLEVLDRDSVADAIRPEVTRKVFEGGGTLGRLPDNTWVLPDRSVSGHHARITCHDGDFAVEDTSRFGVFVNNDDTRLGPGRLHRLVPGDRLFIGPYVISVALTPTVATPLAESAPPAISPAPAGDLIPAQGPRPGVEVDPLIALGLDKESTPRSRRRAEEFASGTPLNEHFAPPVPRPASLPSSARPMPGQSDLPPDHGPSSVAPSPPCPAPRSDASSAEDNVLAALQRDGDVPIPEDYDPFADSVVALGERPRSAPAVPASPRLEAEGLASPLALIPDDYDPLEDTDSGKTPLAVSPVPHSLTAESSPRQERATDTGADYMPADYDPLADLGPSLEPSVPAEMAVDAPGPPRIQVPSSGALWGETDDGPLAPSSGAPPAGLQPLAAAPETSVEEAPASAADRANLSPKDASGSVSGPIKGADGHRLAEGAPDDPDLEVAAPDISGSHVGFAEVLAGAGLDDVEVNTELANNLGRILQVIVGGLVEVLHARTQVKDEFRMAQSHFSPEGNNPLKLSVDAQDSLYNLFVKQSGAYLSRVEAFEDAFDELRDHQLAELRGTQVAFQSVIAGLSPKALERQFDRQIESAAFVRVARSFRYWDLYRAHMEALMKDSEQSFGELFAERFVQAFEEQLDRLRQGRKKNRDS